MCSFVVYPAYDAAARLLRSPVIGWPVGGVTSTQYGDGSFTSQLSYIPSLLYCIEIFMRLVVNQQII